MVSSYSIKHRRRLPTGSHTLEKVIIMNILRVLLVVSVLLWEVSGLAIAQKSPDILVRETVDDILQTIQSDPEVKAGNSDRIKEIMEEKVAPHIDFPRMTRLAVGRAWRDASMEQKKALVKEFHEMLMRSYAAAFKMYNGIVIDTRPLPRLGPEDKQVSVNTVVRLPGGAPPLSVDYDLTIDKDGSWKMYDVRVDGASLVINYRSVFTQELQKGGIDQLIKALSEKNMSGLDQ